MLGDVMSSYGKSVFFSADDGSIEARKGQTSTRRPRSERRFCIFLLVALLSCRRVAPHRRERKETHNHQILTRSPHEVQRASARRDRFKDTLKSSQKS